MITPKVFRPGKFQRWSVLVLGLTGIIFCIFGVIFLIGSGLLTEKPFLFLWITASLIIIFFTIALSYSIWIVWSYRIEFLEDELRVSRYGNPFARPYRCVYENVAYIRRPIMKGSIEVILIRGKPFQFTVFVEGGSDAVVDEFEKHISAEKIQAFLKEELKKHNKADRTRRLIIPSFVWLFMLLLWSPRIMLPLVAWKTAWGESFLQRGYINNYWISENGTAWISFMKSFANDEVVRIDETGIESWVLDNEDDILYADALISGSSEQPWLLRDDILLQWDGTSWQKTQLNGVEIRADPGIVIGDYFWAIASKENEFSKYLIKLDLNTGKVNLFSIPQQLLREGFHIQYIRLTPDKSIVASIIKVDYPTVFFYTFQNEQWTQSHSLSVQSSDPGFPGDQSHIQFRTFTIDNAGQIWVVNNNGGRPVIGRFDALTVSWRWSQTPSDCELCSKSYMDMIVDDLGRVWLSGEYGRKNNVEDKYSFVQGWGLDVLIPHWDGTAEQLVRYTDKNSNYQVGIGNTGIWLSQDGRIWVARDRLVWIDSNNPDLPGVMPDWFVKMTDPGNLLIAYLAVFTLTGILFIGNWIIKKIRANQRGS